MPSRRRFLQQAIAVPFLAGVRAFEIISDSCCLSQESAVGYRSSAPAFNSQGIIVAAGLQTVSLTRIREFYRRVDAGAWLIWERAATFTDQTISESETHFAQVFGVQVSQASSTNALYVRYSRPAPALIRTMGILPRFEHSTAQVIATHAGKPCAFKQNVGKGGLIYLGSMLGPHLPGGDESSQTLLPALLRSI